MKKEILELVKTETAGLLKLAPCVGEEGLTLFRENALKKIMFILGLVEQKDLYKLEKNNTFEIASKDMLIDDLRKREDDKEFSTISIKFVQSTSVENRVDRVLINGNEYCRLEYLLKRQDEVAQALEKTIQTFNNIVEVEPSNPENNYRKFCMAEIQKLLDRSDNKMCQILKSINYRNVAVRQHYTPY